MTGDKDPKLAIFELYLATAEKVGDRRAQANSWMLSVNSAIVGLTAISRWIRWPLASPRKPFGFGRSRQPAQSFASPGRRSSRPIENSIAPSSKS